MVHAVAVVKEPLPHVCALRYREQRTADITQACQLAEQTWTPRMTVPAILRRKLALGVACICASTAFACRSSFAEAAKLDGENAALASRRSLFIVNLALAFLPLTLAACTSVSPDR